MITVSTFCHTHWDHEWYFTENESIIQFLYHMDEVIEFLQASQERIYVLDGQMAILEDYLQYAPEKEQDIIDFVSKGQLIIGPWYSQTDELIITGESMVRNLFYGIQSAKRFGSYMKVGYLPDSFGQAKNMPKIFCGFDIPYAIFWRGVDRTQVNQREFIWESGSDQVLCYNIKNGYFLGGETWMTMENPKQIEKTFLDQCKTNRVLLPIGSDQRKVDGNYAEIMAQYNALAGECHYIEQSPEDFMNDLRLLQASLPIVEGEFISSIDSKIHHSIYSMRYDHKYIQDKVERRLIYQIESLSVMLGMDGVPIKYNAIREIWKTLMKSQAHDSACGCNSDKTNTIILSRLEKADQLSYSLVDYLLRKYTESLQIMDELSVLFINTLSFPRQTCRKVLLNTKEKNFEVYLKDRNIPFEVLSQERVYSGIFGNDPTAYEDDLYYYQTTISLTLQFKAFEKIILTIVEIEKEQCLLKADQENKIQNDYYEVEFSNGKLHLLDKQKSQRIKDWLSVVDDGDDGDSYDFSPLVHELPIICDFSEATRICYQNKHQLIVEGSWKLPETIEERIKGNWFVHTPYKLSITLQGKRLDCHLEVLNKTKAHRLRVHLKTALSCDTSFADTAFGIINRECHPKAMEHWRQNGYKEEPTPIYPMLNMCGLRDENTTVTVFSKGMKEYEIRNKTTIALTLFRSVGLLGKADLIRRPGNPSGNQFKRIETPDAQVKKNLVFKFSYSRQGMISDAKITRECQDYMVSIPYHQKQKLNRFTNTLQYFNVNPLHNIEMKDFYVAIEDDEIVLTALIPISKKEFAMRFVNYSNKQRDVKLKMADVVSKCTITNMKYEVMTELEYSTKAVLSFASQEIKTLVFSLK